MTSTKKSWKLQEFVAHSSNVTCLAIGPTSGRVMVTGGEDKKVNMWAIGKPNVLLSLSGHTTPVQCVQFNSSEELVCAGSQSGTLKIWDPEAAKVVRTLTGHKADIKSLDFHPYGEFVASGSLDTTVRLWDVRRKGCIISYKGHTNAVNHLQFSPDGRWVISAGEDGLVKLWDLNAGKLLADFILHTGPVNKVEFHPREFLVATGSSDRTVKFWDLETFGLISSTDVEASAVRSIRFHPEGLCLFSGGHDSLRAYSWEPSICYEAQTLGWGNVSDMAFSSNQLIGASYQGANVGIWVANMMGLEDTIERTTNEAYVGKVEINHSVQQLEQPTYKKQSPSRKSFPTRPKTSSSKTKKPAAKEEDSGLDEFNKTVEEKLGDPNYVYENIFKPSTGLSRSPTAQRKNPEPFLPKDDEKQKALPQLAEAKPAPVSVSKNKETVPAATPAQNQQIVYQPPMKQQEPFQPPHSEADHKPYPNASPNSAAQFPVQYQQQSRVSQPSQQPRTSQASQQPRASQTPQQSRASQQSRQARQQPAVDERMKGLNLNDFSKVKDNVRSQTPNDEESTLAILERSHTSICQIMQARLKNLSLVSKLWTDGDIKAAVESASSMSDQSVFVDIMNILAMKQSLWTLDICGAVLPQLKILFSSNYESYIETGSQSLKLVLKNFSQLIKSSLSVPPGAIGVDLSREERYQKCDKCFKAIKDIRYVINERTHTPGRIGTLCRELSLALTVFD